MDAKRRLDRAALREDTRKAVGLVAAMYPNRAMADARTYLEAASSALVGFPLDVITRMADPRTGIVRECKFLPSIAELCEWCAQAVERLKTDIRQAEDRMRLLDARAESVRVDEPVDKPATDEERAAVVERVMARWPRKDREKLDMRAAVEKIDKMRRGLSEAEVESGRRLVARSREWDDFETQHGPARKG